MSPPPAAPPARAKLIEAGIDILLERGAGVGVDVRLTEAAERAGLTTGAAYNVWRGSRDGGGGQQQYQRELAAEMLNRFSDDQPSELRARVEALIAARLSFPDLIRIVAQQHMERLLERRKLLSVLYALYGSAFMDDSVRAGALESYTKITALYRELYELIIPAAGRRMRQEFSYDDLTISLSSITEGFVLRLMIDSDLAGYQIETSPTGHEPIEKWNLFSINIHAVMSRMTEPVGQ